MSGNFLQRGLPAVCNKFMRAEMAVASGVDAVFELPVVYATASARDFAYAGGRPSEQTEHCRLSGFWCGM